MSVVNLRGICQLLFILLCSSFIDIYIAQQSDVPEIVEAPSSLLVPVNTQAVFICKVHCIRDCSLQWFIGNSSTRNQHQIDYYETRGFMFSSDQNNSLHTLRLTVNATMTNNNTFLRCHAVFNSRGSTAITSDTALLQVICESPVLPNPVVAIRSPTSLVLKWSPPFLWPGYHIDFFVVSTINKTDDHIITIDRINVTLNDVILTLNKGLNNEHVEDCNEFLFSISAFNEYHGMYPEILNVTGGYPSDITELLSVNISVYFTSKAIPKVRITIRLPPSVCSYQELNYTMFIENISDNHTLIYGPYYHQGSGSIKEDIAQGLRKDKDYSLRIVFCSYFYEYTSYNHTFDTNFHPVLESAFDSCKADFSVVSLKVAVGVCVAVILLMALVLVSTVWICGYSSWRSRVRSINNMRSMNCTIHDGPAYESIQQKPDVFTGQGSQQILFQVTTLGDQQDGAEKKNEEQKPLPHAHWKKERPILDADGTYIAMNPVGALSTSVNT